MINNLSESNKQGQIVIIIMGLSHKLSITRIFLYMGLDIESQDLLCYSNACAKIMGESSCSLCAI